MSSLLSRVAVLAVVSLSPVLAAAQAALPLVLAPTRGVLQPGVGVADAGEAALVAVNPAGLGDLPAPTLLLRHSELSAGYAMGVGRGTGLYAAAPLPVPLLAALDRRLQLGAGLELLRPTDSGDGARPFGLGGRLLLAASARVADWAALGLSFSQVFGGPGAPGLSSFDVGVRLRSPQRLALGFVLRDVNAPTFAGAVLQRGYELELLLRPAADDRVLVAAGARVGEQRGDVAPRLRLALRPRPGLTLALDGQLRIEAGQPLGYQAALGLQVDLAHVGANAFGVLSGTGAPSAGGASLALRVSGARYAALWRSDDSLYRLPFAELSGDGFLRAIVALRRIAGDRRARGVLLLGSEGDLGWGRASELRAALLALRRAGKRVFAYGASYGPKGYLVASAAERVFLDPAGALRVDGVALSSFFLKDALEQLGVRAEILRVGAYKATPETFVRSGPSEPARADREALAEDLYGILRAALIERGLAAEQAKAAIDRGLYTPMAAQAAHLVDEVADETQVEAALGSALSGAPRLLALPTPVPPRAGFGVPAVAVINLEGDLLGSESLQVPFLNTKILGLRSALAALDDAASDPNVRALVLRVESPGGSSIAADLIDRAVVRARRRMPVLCSFGDVAASGGYYLAAHCDRIYIGAGGITGSIGIFGGKADLSGLLRRLGVVRTGPTRGANAGSDDPFRPYTDAERALQQAQLQAGYDRFVEVVAAGRRLSAAQVEAAAAGRVFTGSRAVAARLCDEVGGLDDAVAEARRRAGLPPLAREAEDEGSVRFYPRREPSLLGRALAVLGLPGSAAGADVLAGLLRSFGAALVPVALLQEGAVARLEGPLPK